MVNQKGLLPLKVRQFIYYALLFMLFSHIVIVGLLCATPPISRDALIYHLAIPKLWLKHGCIYETPWQFAYSPMNINLLYLACLWLGSDILSKFVHFAFGLGTAILIYRYLKIEKVGRNWALLGALLFLTTPVVARLALEAYIDLGLTFFVTLAVLSISKWRRSKYAQTPWLLVSGVAIGIAIGSDYSAMIAFLFLGFMVVYFYAKDTHQQTKAMQYGIYFALISLLLFAPWGIRNYLWTSNPLYPHFNELFNPSRPEQIGTGGISGFFHMRELVYGETFWETLTIPIRFFFEGRDNSEQFFAGRLNPILIVGVPFAFLGQAVRRDRNFFLGFSAFFVWVVYFVAAKHIRLIVPVLPILTLLCIGGLKNLSEVSTKRPFLAIIVFISIGIALLVNSLYIKHRFSMIRPLPYVLGQESRDQFLSRNLGSYPAIAYINRHLPKDARVSLIFVGHRTYYLDRPYQLHAGYGMTVLKNMVQASHEPGAFLVYLRSLGSTHLLIRNDLFEKYLQDNFTSDSIQRFFALTSQYWELLYQDPRYTVFQIKLRAD